MEAQLQRKHIKATSSFGLAALLAAALVGGAGAGYAIGTIAGSSQATVAPAPVTLETSRSAHDDWAMDSTPALVDGSAADSRSIRDDWAFEAAEVQSTASLRAGAGVETRHREAAEAAQDDVVTQTIDADPPLQLGRPY
jgi:hypothetical protein